MARKPEVQYIRYYTDGSAARQLEPKAPRKRKTALPKSQRQKRKVVYVDPVAIGGIAVSAVMLVMMAVGSVQMYNAHRQNVQMEAYVQSLSRENAVLQDTYEAGIDLEEIEQSALALGMIPEAQAQTFTVSVEMPQIVEEPTFWEKVGAFLTGLFA